MRVTYNTERDEFGSTHIECKKSQWDTENQTFKGKSIWAQEQNKKLNAYKHRIEKQIEDLERENDEVTISLIKHAFCNKQRSRGGQGTISQRRTIFTLIEVCVYHYQLQEKRHKLGKLSKSTLEIQSNYAANISDYLIFAKRDKLPATSLNQDFMDDMALYFTSVEKFGAGHIENHLKFVKQALKMATERQLILKNPLANYRIEASEEEPDTTHLTIEQLERLITFDFLAMARAGELHPAAAESLDKERDAFVFNCFTGMHHCDYKSKLFRIDKDKNEEYWLIGKRQKTKKEFFLKLLEPGVAVLKKYGESLEALPVKSNQKRNDTLKLIAAYLGLPVRLSTKIARKTFADLALNEMLIPADDVATMLGLTSTERLKHYARPRRNRLARLLSSWETLSSHLHQNEQQAA
ncbi:phage integrase SAM-like domain-containing protein [Spirosoma telluris]